ncbi:MAG: acyl-CoA thioesterase II [Actinomycetales bacterium]|nr:acyl-CoA thioesterase II [Actinomycetales bacterium]
MPSSVAEGVNLLDIEQLEVNLFRGSQPENSNLTRVFGGQVAGQAVMAALRTVPDDRHLHSLHVYFLLGGDPSLPIIYDVESVRDGRSFNTRRVSARQHGKVIFFMTASFQVEEEGWEHQNAIPKTIPPEEATSLPDLIAMVDEKAAEAWQQEWGGFESRYVGDPRPLADPSRETMPVVQHMWFKVNEALPDDPNLHQAIFTYFSDFSLLAASLVPQKLLISSPKVQPASLDHVIWFHRPFRMDEWLLYDQSSPSASGARGLSTGGVFSEDGRLVASVAQDGLIRPTTPRP